MSYFWVLPHSRCAWLTRLLLSAAMKGPAEATLELGTQSALQQKMARSAVHLALQGLEAVDLPFDLALRMSGQLYPMT